MLAANVFGLGEGGGFLAQMFIRRTNVFATTKLSYEALNPPLLPNPCYLLGFFRSTVCRVKFALSVCVGLVALLHFLGWLEALKKMQMCYQMRWLFCRFTFCKV
jgi:hypothetical protein